MKINTVNYDNITDNTIKFTFSDYAAELFLKGERLTFSNNDNSVLAGSVALDGFTIISNIAGLEIIYDPTSTAFIVAPTVTPALYSSPDLKLFSESHLSALTAVTKSFSLVDELLANGLTSDNSDNKLLLFFNNNYDYSKYNTGSYIKQYGTSLITGLGFNKHLTNNQLSTLGIFLELGADTFKSNTNGKNGKGNTKNYGAGLLAKYKIKNLYFDASAKMGQIISDFETDDTIHYYNSINNLRSLNNVKFDMVKPVISPEPSKPTKMVIIKSPTKPSLQQSSRIECDENGNCVLLGDDTINLKLFKKYL